ncbi:MAG: HD domain-containing protein [Ruminococcaceae bacterium]|nr:HD domain-containing protein [Oscillospiraceae bacterium]
MNITKVISAITEYFSGDPKRVGHFLKVYAFSKTIGEAEKLSAENQEILEIAAAVHDIGIKKSEELYGSSSGKYQEMLGPDEAEKLLNKLGVDEKIIERVCFLVGHHHTYNMIDGLDYQILVEADFLVNAYEDNLSKNAIINVRNKLFKTKTATKMLNDIFALENNQNDKT